jgi:deoxyhypusine synthase
MKGTKLIINRQKIEQLFHDLPADTKKQVEQAVTSIVSAKKRGGKIVVVTGSGPNMHEGVTTLIAELIRKEIIDGVTTSSAVIAHEMAGALDQVKRVDGKKIGFTSDILPRGDIFEVTVMPPDMVTELKNEMILDVGLMDKVLSADGEVIIKAAGNMAYPMGLRTENLAKEIMIIARSKGLPFEAVAGAGADERTMLGAAYNRNIPLLVTIPQLVGGGMVGLAIGDSISLTERATKIAQMMASADVIIESAVVLTQEIHDGPFETYTGHGIWSNWEGYTTYSLSGKTLIRIDTDPNLLKAWEFEKKSSKVQEAIDKGLPKTKIMDIPFRMEMSGFARLENSLPTIGDIGVIWPVIAVRLEKELGIAMDFISYPQGTPEGEEMRNWIVKNIWPIDKKKLHR